MLLYVTKFLDQTRAMERIRLARLRFLGIAGKHAADIADDWWYIEYIVVIF